MLAAQAPQRTNTPMPEGDTIHKLAAAIRPRLEGRTICQAWVRVEPRGTFKRGPASTAAGPSIDHGDLAGHRVEKVYAEGKHLFFEFEQGVLVRSHLGMYGDWHRYQPDEPWRKPEWQTSLALWTEQDVLVCFNAKEVELLKAATIRHANFRNRLGPDLLAPLADLGLAPHRARELLDADAPLVDVLLDQRIASGIGNVYKSEVLFMERKHPQRTLGDTPNGELQSLYARARDLLSHNLGGGPRVTRFVPDGRGSLWVYARRGQPCFRCGARIRASRLGRDMRSTYWCPICQIA